MAQEKPGKPVILLVDDQEIDNFLGRVLLSRRGFCVQTVDTGQQALIRFREVRPSAVVIDIYMPGINGFETCAEIRKLPGGTGIPIILVSGDSGEGLRARASACGADALLEKANDGEEIVRRLCSLLADYANR